MSVVLQTGVMYYRESQSDDWHPLILKVDTDLSALIEDYSQRAWDLGEYCRYSSAIYRCTTAITTPEVWDSTHWQETTIGEELKNITDITGDGDLDSGFTASDLTGAANELKTDVGDLEDITGDGSLSGFTATDLTGAANELKDTLNSLDSDDIANASTNVSGATVTAAIDNLNTALATVPDFAPKTAIPQNSNLNDYRTAGTYYVQTDAIAATIGNMPRSASGTLIVIIRSSGNIYLQQFYLPTSTIKKIYTRTYNNGTWTSWGEIPTDIFVITGTRTTSAAGATDFAETYNCNQYMCLSVVATGAVAGYILLPYKYGDAANGRWGFQALKSGDLSTIKTTSIAYAAVMMKYA